MPDIVSTLLGYLPLILGACGVLVVAFLCVKNLGSTQIGIVEKRFIGKKLPSARAFATKGEQGIQAGYKLGFTILCYPFYRLVGRHQFVVISSTQVGLVEATDGEPLPSGKVFAEDKCGTHDNFQDPVAFLNEGGVRGSQLRFLTPGQYKVHPGLFKVTPVERIVVPEGKIGQVSSEEGEQLPEGELVAKRIKDHNNFQNAETFIKNGGQKGPQVDFLRPGTYNIHTGVFKVKIVDAVIIPNGKIGVVEARAGKAMGHDDVVAATPAMDLHQSFQDGQAFLTNGGVRGPQEAVLRPGKYYINTLLFDVELKDITRINQGEVGVIVSHIGKDPAALFAGHDAEGTAPVSASATDPEEKRVDAARQRYVVPRGFRGIQPDVLGPGNYNINPRAQTVLTVPTTTRSVEWSEGAGKGDFNPFTVVSKDGFEMKVEVRCQYRILPENAPYVVAKLGSIAELEKNVIHPQIDGIFRAEVSKAEAIRYQQSRAEEQKRAETEVRIDLAQYKVEVVSVMICNIVLPEQLMHITQQKNLAEQSEAMFTAQEAAEKTRIKFNETKANADQQQNIIAAQAGIKIAEHEAAQSVARAEGEAKRILAVAAARAGEIKQIGDAEAGVIEAKGAATTKAYVGQAQALGKEGLTAVEVATRIADAGLQITPHIMVSGDGASGGGLGAALLAMVVQDKATVATTTAPAAVPAATESQATK